MAHTHTVIDDDKHFIINPDTRTITFASETLPKLIQFDHNSERFTFEIPPEIDGHDMTLCNKVQVHFININKDNPEEFNPSIYEAKDLGLNATGDKLVFTWLVDQSATLLAGPLNFAILFMCTSEEENEDGETEVVLDYRWGTDPYEGVTVSDGMDNNEALSNQYYEVVDQWYATIESAATVAINDINTVKNEALENASVEYESFKSRVNTVVTEGVKKVSDSNTAAVKSVQNAETKAVNNIDEHATSVLENWSDTKIGTDILSEVTKLRGDIAKLSSTRKCKPGVVYGGDDYVYQMIDELYGGDTVDYILGDGIGPFVVSHDHGTKIKSIKQIVFLYLTTTDDTWYKLCAVELDWLNPPTDVPSGAVMSYAMNTGYVNSDGSYIISDNAKVYPNAPVFVIEPVSAFPAYGNTCTAGKDHVQPILICPVVFNDTKQALKYASMTDIGLVGDNGAVLESGAVVNIAHVATYLVITPPDDANFEIRMCKGDDKEFTLKENGIIGIDGPVERNLEDEYTIVLDDGTTKEFKIPNGNSAGIRTAVSGEIVRCDDVIDVEHTVKVTARSKNLLKPFYKDIDNDAHYEHICDGLDLYAADDHYNGGVCLVGIGTIRTVVRFANANDPLILKPGTYTFSLGEAIPTVSEDVYAILEEHTSSGDWVRGVVRIEKGRSSVTFTLTKTTRIGGYLNIPAYADLDGYAMHPQIEVGSSATAFTPYVDVAGATITLTGKNLIPYPHMYGTGSIAGVTYTVNSDGTIVVNGTATEDSIQYMVTTSPYLQLVPGTYTLSGCPSGGGQSTYRVCIKTSDSTPGYYYDTGNSNTFTLTETKLVQLYIYVGKGTTVNNLTFKPQLEVGSKATEYESYVEAEDVFEIDEDGQLTRRMRSIAPTMTLRPDEARLILDVEYNRDYQALPTTDELADDIYALSESVSNLEMNVNAFDSNIGAINDALLELKNEIDNKPDVNGDLGGLKFSINEDGLLTISTEEE